MQNADVLPPGQGRAIGVDVVGFMPVGSDNLLGYSLPVFIVEMLLRRCGETANKGWISTLLL